ncbi:MAG: helix-turn-helix domain-containing protein [Chloroflexi bacterium]|nr:MAG: helix-turn-helix domain-containing protein [Chloroflexota bacterium]
MAPKTDNGLGATLKSLRTASGMTQEELAERAGISARTVSDLERGLRATVHHDTARRLASALELGEEQRRKFEAITRGRAFVPSSPPAPGGLPAVPTPFFGRSRELESVKSTLVASHVRLLTLTGAGGIGKTRLALEAAAEIGRRRRDRCRSRRTLDRTPGGKARAGRPGHLRAPDACSAACVLASAPLP